MPRQTIMVRCPHDDCYELMPKGAKGCDKHRHLKPHKCAECGCVIYGQVTYCTDCKRSRNLQAQRLFKA